MRAAAMPVFHAFDILCNGKAAVAASSACIRVTVSVIPELSGFALAAYISFSVLFCTDLYPVTNFDVSNVLFLFLIKKLNSASMVVNRTYPTFLSLHPDEEKLTQCNHTCASDLKIRLGSRF